MDPSCPTESKTGQQTKLLVYLSELFDSFATSIKASPGKRRTEQSQNTVLLTSTQATIKGTAQYSMAIIRQSVIDRTQLGHLWQ